MFLVLREVTIQWGGTESEGIKNGKRCLSGEAVHGEAGCGGCSFSEKGVPSLPLPKAEEGGPFQLISLPPSLIPPFFSHPFLPSFFPLSFLPSFLFFFPFPLLLLSLSPSFPFSLYFSFASSSPKGSSHIYLLDVLLGTHDKRANLLE